MRVLRALDVNKFAADDLGVGSLFLRVSGLWRTGGDCFEGTHHIGGSAELVEATKVVWQ